MRQLGGFRIEVIALFRRLTLLRGYRSQPENPQHRLVIAGIVTVSFLMSNICCPVAGMGEDLPELGPSPGTIVPNVPEEYSETQTDNISEPISFLPQETESSASTGYEMPSIIRPVEDPANAVISIDELGYADQYSPTATSELLIPMSSAPVMLLPKTFVHERRTVRTSERTAEIWVKLPKDSQSSVSVNFVEHPPEGDFRIFRTRINTHEPRRFYLSAKRWDVQANRWIDLVAVPSLSSDETPDLGYVDLGPGQRRVVTFTDSQRFETVVDVPLIHAPLNQKKAEVAPAPAP